MITLRLYPAQTRGLGAGCWWKHECILLRLLLEKIQLDDKEMPMRQEQEPGFAEITGWERYFLIDSPATTVKNAA